MTDKENPMEQYQSGYQNGYRHGLQDQFNLDRLAAMAMQGLCTSHAYEQATSFVIANDAYNVAEAMLAERDRRREGVE